MPYASDTGHPPNIPPKSWPLSVDTSFRVLPCIFRTTPSRNIAHCLRRINVVLGNTLMHLFFFLLFLSSFFLLDSLAMQHMPRNSSIDATVHLLVSILFITIMTVVQTDFICTAFLDSHLGRCLFRQPQGSLIRKAGPKCNVIFGLPLRLRWPILFPSDI